MDMKSEKRNQMREGTDMVYEAIRGLVEYGLAVGLIAREDAIYARNQILDVMKLDEYVEPETEREYGGLEEILAELLDDACARGILEDSVVSPG